MWYSRQGFTVWTETKGVIHGALDVAGIGRVQVTLQDPRIDHAPVLLGFDGKMRKPIEAPLVGFVEDFPIDQASVAGQTDTAGANASQGKEISRVRLPR